jgi:hypothetical protein
MLAGIFATKKRAACFETPRAKKRKKRRRIQSRTGLNPGFARPTNAGGKAVYAPDLNGSMSVKRFETGRPFRAVALSNYPSSCYGLAGGVAAAGEVSAAGDAIAPVSLVFL